MRLDGEGCEAQTRHPQFHTSGRFPFLTRHEVTSQLTPRQHNMFKWHVHSAIGRGRPAAHDLTRVADGIAASLRQFSISASRYAEDGNGGGMLYFPSCGSLIYVYLDQLIANISSRCPPNQVIFQIRCSLRSLVFEPYPISRHRRPFPRRQTTAILHDSQSGRRHISQAYAPFPVTGRFQRSS